MDVGQFSAAGMHNCHALPTDWPPVSMDAEIFSTDSQTNSIGLWQQPSFGVYFKDIPQLTTYQVDVYKPIGQITRPAFEPNADANLFEWSRDKDSHRARAKPGEEWNPWLIRDLLVWNRVTLLARSKEWKDCTQNGRRDENSLSVVQVESREKKSLPFSLLHRIATFWREILWHHLTSPLAPSEHRPIYLDPFKVPCRHKNWSSQAHSFPNNRWKCYCNPTRTIPNRHIPTTKKNTHNNLLPSRKNQSWQIIQQTPGWARCSLALLHFSSHHWQLQLNKMDVMAISG